MFAISISEIEKQYKGGSNADIGLIRITVEI